MVAVHQMSRPPDWGRDHHQNDDAAQDLSTHGPFFHARRLREVTTFEFQKVMNGRRVRRMLGRNAQYAICRVRVGDCAAFFKPRTNKDGEKHEARRLGPAGVMQIGGATRHLISWGALYSAPLHLVKVYLPNSAER